MNTLSIDELRRTLSGAKASVHGKDFFIMDFVYHPDYKLKIKYPCKFDGVICMFCIEGQYDLTCGLEHYDLSEDFFAMALPGDIVSLYPKAEMKGKIRIMALSDDLIKEMSLDMINAQIAFKTRAVKVSRHLKLLIHHFRNLFRSIISQPHDNTRKSLALLISSMFIEMTRIWNIQGEDVGVHRTSDMFIAMVNKEHMEHRDLEYYASRMNLTPKYLSAVIKKETGQTALQHIVDRVIMEAKYYLKHTDMSVKQIAYELNFNNQMDFYRYFKRHEGTSPSDFRSTKL